MTTNLSIVQQAIEIQGYITVRVAGHDRQVKSVKAVGGDWYTDILTPDLCGYVRIRKTKDNVVRQARWIIEHATEIRAKRDARAKAIAQLATN